MPAGVADPHQIPVVDFLAAAFAQFVVLLALDDGADFCLTRKMGATNNNMAITLGSTTTTILLGCDSNATTVSMSIAEARTHETHIAVTKITHTCASDGGRRVAAAQRIGQHFGRRMVRMTIVRCGVLFGLMMQLGMIVLLLLMVLMMCMMVMMMMRMVMMMENVVGLMH